VVNHEFSGRETVIEQAERVAKAQFEALQGDVMENF
jgi:hypothetical protein